MFLRIPKWYLPNFFVAKFVKADYYSLIAIMPRLFIRSKEKVCSTFYFLPIFYKLVTIYKIKCFTWFLLLLKSLLELPVIFLLLHNHFTPCLILATHYTIKKNRSLFIIFLLKISIILSEVQNQNLQLFFLPRVSYFKTCLKFSQKIQKIP